MAQDNKESFGFVMHDIARLMRWIFDRRAQKIGLTRSQWFVLAHLRRHNGIKQAGLAEILEIQPMSLVHLLDKLEESGWVERREDPNDRRAKLVFLTEKVAPVLEEMQEIGKEVREIALSGIEEPERDAFMNTLLHIRANLSEKSKEPS